MIIESINNNEKTDIYKRLKELGIVCAAVDGIIFYSTDEFKEEMKNVNSLISTV